MRASGVALGAWLLAAAACRREDILVAEVDPPAATTSVPPGGSCHESEQCEPTFYCEHGACGKAEGVCVPRPSSCELGPEVCGCDGVSYPGDCIRRAVGVTLAHPGHCKKHP